VLDGDTLRAGRNRDLAFSESDRNKNNRRIAAMAGLLAEAGQMVIVSVISSLATDCAFTSDIVGPGFNEIHVRADVVTRMARDPKALAG
jgi:bifunctional enzyme CysN/CysC